jgi:hypothetical protein
MTVPAVSWRGMTVLVLGLLLASGRVSGAEAGDPFAGRTNQNQKWDWYSDRFQRAGDTRDGGEGSWGSRQESVYPRQGNGANTWFRVPDEEDRRQRPWGDVPGAYRYGSDRSSGRSGPEPGRAGRYGEGRGYDSGAYDRAAPEMRRSDRPPPYSWPERPAEGGYRQGYGSGYDDRPWPYPDERPYDGRSDGRPYDAGPYDRPYDRSYDRPYDRGGERDYRTPVVPSDGGYPAGRPGW